MRCNRNLHYSKHVRREFIQANTVQMAGKMSHVKCLEWLLVRRKIDKHRIMCPVLRMKNQPQAHNKMFSTK